MEELLFTSPEESIKQYECQITETKNILSMKWVEKKILWEDAVIENTVEGAL